MSRYEIGEAGLVQAVDDAPHYYVEGHAQKRSEERWTDGGLVHLRKKT
jgi:hypothetical protein